MWLRCGAGNGWAKVLSHGFEPDTKGKRRWWESPLTIVATRDSNDGESRFRGSHPEMRDIFSPVRNEILEANVGLG